ncbi:MAG: flagellar hook-associated protein FlgK [Brevundimonas sp.]|uniref:flagellar hook-associated protein FlgK n=1 Tax=Brevundimonas sp. TaxID=1871086 RepID=UPI0012125323|nr:flagellar hook-associated protein FlgK [Brevundimonas sp.]RZJ18595.1 MAG: flagellar hook-associated protein FlgK [Brevundimonas sp.]
MSLNSILNIATSGLNTAQQQLRVVSDNVSNVNTPGYIRKVADQRSLSTQGAGNGVEVARIRLATDRFLQAASLNAGAEASRQNVRYELYDRIQSLFGDPGGNSSFFSQVDGIFSAFGATVDNAASSPLRQDALFKAQALFEDSARISKQIQAAREDADGRLTTAVERTNALLQQIEKLNIEIARATVKGDDSSGAETTQAALVSELSQLMDVRVSGRSVGGVSIRTGGGALLAGDGYATLSYNRAGSVNAQTSFNEIWVTEPSGQKRALLDTVSSGEIRGLVELRDVEAPQAAERLGELMSRVADELNRAHNANTSLPPPTTMTGRNVGQSFETAIAGFTGRSTIAVTNAAGVVQNTVEIVFSGATMTINGSPATPATFLSVLNTELGGDAVASFNNGVLSLQATGTNGIAIAEDPASASDKAGRGFSHYFGLNDLVTTNGPSNYDLGLKPGSLHGFTAGQALTLRLTGESGAKARDITITVPPGGTVADMLAALNDPATGIGRFGQFSLDPTTGAVTYKSTSQPPLRLSVLDDNTTQTPSGVSLSDMFGIGGGVRAARADGFSIRSDIRANPSLLALAQIDLSVAAGVSAISKGDGRGAARLADAGQRSSVFQAAGDSSGGTLSISRYSSELSGDIGGKASLAETRSKSATALFQEASARQASREGVNLDEELVMMTVYQQAYNASARLVQAAKDMYDVLLGMAQ